MKVFLVDGQTSYLSWIPNAQRVRRIEEADLVLFEGGEDVSPNLYGEPVHPATYISPNRDKAEVALFKKAHSLGKKLLGICRGLSN